MKSGTDRTRTDMRTLAKVIGEVRKQYPKMELGHLHCLLLVLSEPYQRMQDMVEPTGFTKQSVSRNIKALSERSYLQDDDGKPRLGMNLVTVLTNEMDDARAKICAPTRGGTKLAERLSEILHKGEPDGTSEGKPMAS